MSERGRCWGTAQDAVGLDSDAREGRNQSKIRQKFGMPVACGPAMARRLWKQARRVAGPDVKIIRESSRLYWRRKELRGGGGWQDRAMTMAVISIKGRTDIKACACLLVSLFCRQEQLRRHNDSSRTWKVRTPVAPKWPGSPSFG